MGFCLLKGYYSGITPAKRDGHLGDKPPACVLLSFHFRLRLLATVHTWHYGWIARKTLLFGDCSWNSLKYLAFAIGNIPISKIVHFLSTAKIGVFAPDRIPYRL